MDKKKKPTINSILKSTGCEKLKQNYYFKTTLERYIITQENIERLRQQIEEDGATVEKEYVKGRKNVYAHPAIAEINKSITVANGTMATLLNIIKNTPEEEGKSKLQDMFEQLNSD